jgi:probable rRNA maturation factor
MEASESESFSLRNTTKQRIPRLPFEDMKNAALGKSYSLSLVFCGDKLSRKLNRTHRDKDKPTNILSFPLDTENGEIFIDLRLARKQSPDFERNFENFIGFLFIHGLIHLKGYEHGSRMESEEVKMRARFKI